MANKQPKPEEIITKLRQVEVLRGTSMPRLDGIRKLRMAEQTYYRWKKVRWNGNESIERTEKAEERERAAARGGGRSVAG